MKKILSFLLALSMVLSCMPMPVLAEETQPETVVTEHTVPEATEATEPTVSETTVATEPEVVCTCESDDPTWHAPFCALFEMPENPVCHCAEKCTEDAVNEWCEVCYFDQSACGGEGEGVPFTGASGTWGENLTWELTAEGTLTISGTGAMTSYSSNNRPWQDYLARTYSVVIESGVTSIAAYAFYDCFNLTTISIPDSVQNIGSSAFYGCINLKSVTIPAGVSKILDRTFCNCTRLETVNLPDSITSISEYAFGYCEELTTLTIPANVSSIGYSAFYSCDKLNSIILPSGLKEIKSSTFYNCDALTEITIPAFVTTIWESAFYDCDSLKTITFLGKAPKIYEDAFYNVTADAWYPEGFGWTEADCQDYGGKLTWNTSPSEHEHIFGDDHKCECGAIGGKCGDDLYWIYDGEGTITITGTGTMYSYSNTDENNRCPWVEYEDDITTVVIEEGATSVGYCAFNACDRLQNVSLPETLTKIAAHGFSFCPALEEIQLPDGLQEIGSFAFSNSGLKSIHLGTAVEVIGDLNPFRDCQALQQITVAANNPYYCAVDNVLFTKDMKTLLCYAGGLTQESYTIPDGVTTVGHYGFSENKNIKTVNMPDTVETLRYGAFMACRNLHQISLSSGLQTIGDLVFNHTNIENITIPASVKSIGYLSFVPDVLETIVFEGDMPQIDSGAFGNENFQTVATAYYPAGNPTWTADKLQNYGGELTWLPSDHEHTDDLVKDHRCDLCGEVISLCADTDDHKCDICDEVISLCADDNNDHKCDTCGEIISLCADDNNDHKCDICGESVSLCEDTDDDHKCDTCGEIISLCADGDNDHACDICGKEIGLCADGNNDHKCDACGEVISLCTGGEATCAAAAICDICGQSYGELNGQYHTGSTEIRNKKEATESEPGYTGDIHCLDCGELLEAGTEIPVLPAPSVPSTPVQPSKPNWTNIFNKWFGNWWGNGDDEEEKCDHSYKAVVTDPTCTEKGYTTHTCEKCGDSYKDSYVDATGHNYVRNVCKHCGAKKSIGWFDWIFKWYR